MTYRRYRVSPSDKRPLLDFIVRALETSGCTVLEVSDLNEAPYRITFESPTGERIGIIAYVFLANNKQIKNRPPDEHRFQIKYGSDFESMHEIWQDPYRLYTTLLFGVNPEAGFFVGADPSLNNPTRFSVSKEFKDHQAAEIAKRGWYAWERGRQGNELEHVPGMGFHSARRKFANDLKPTTNLRDLAYMGGWKSPVTLLTVYQQPDLEVQRASLAGRNKVGTVPQSQAN